MQLFFNCQSDLFSSSNVSYLPQLYLFPLRAMNTRHFPFFDLIYAPKPLVLSDLCLRERSHSMQVPSTKVSLSPIESIISCFSAAATDGIAMNKPIRQDFNGIAAIALAYPKHRTFSVTFFCFLQCNEPPNRFPVRSKCFPACLT